MMVHAVAEEAGGGVLAGDDAADGFVDVVAVEAEIGIFAGGEESHQRQAGDGGALLLIVPAAFGRLIGGEILQAAIVHFANVAGDDFALVFVGKLG